MQKFALAAVQGLSCGIGLGLVLLVGGQWLRPAVSHAQETTAAPSPALYTQAVLSAETENKAVGAILATRQPGQPAEETLLHLQCLTIAQNRRILTLLTTPPGRPMPPRRKSTRSSASTSINPARNTTPPGCRFVTQDSTPVTLSEAKRQGFTPCALCEPGE